MESSEYIAPEACLFRIDAGCLFAVSPTGEDFTDPVEYQGF